MIPLFKVYMSTQVDDKLCDVLHSGFIGQGEKEKEFEHLLHQRMHYNYGVTVNSATSGLHLALRLCKDASDRIEVLSTPLTCLATNFPILANNLKIKWVDIDEDTLNMSIDSLNEKISEQTLAVMMVHWGGRNCFDNSQDIAFDNFNNYDSFFIQDCSHSFGATLNNRDYSNIDLFDYSVYSFQAIKHLTTGDGGLLVCNYYEDYKKAKLLRWYGVDRDTEKTIARCDGDVQDYGYKFHMNDINATIGIENLKTIDLIINKHKENAKYYNTKLKDVNGVRLLRQSDNVDSSYWLYSMRVERRSDFEKHMLACGIQVNKVHERNDLHSCMKEFRCELPNLEKVVNEMISIPVGWWVSHEDREYIVECIKKGW